MEVAAGHQASVRHGKFPVGEHGDIQRPGKWLSDGDAGCLSGGRRAGPVDRDSC